MAASSSSSAHVSSAESSTTQTTPLPFLATSVITPVKLNSENFTAWENDVLRWFRCHGLADHLRKKAMEIAEEERKQWIRIDQQLVCLLWQSIHPRLMANFRRYRTCCDIWNQVVLRHRRHAGMRIRLHWEHSVLRYWGGKASSRMAKRVREARLLSDAFRDLKIETRNTSTTNKNNENNQESDMDESKTGIRNAEMDTEN